MENTIIKISVKSLYLKENALLNEISRNITSDCDIVKYKACYNGNIEEGYTFTFFNTLDKYALIFIHNLFKNLFSDYGCYYIENRYFTGCIKDYLFNKGCKVQSIYK